MAGSGESGSRTLRLVHTVQDITTFATRLDIARISYELTTYRNAVSFLIAVPGERWEVDFLVDGTIEVEVFKSDGNNFDGSKLDDLFHRHTG
jgi:hypothetical protein